MDSKWQKYSHLPVKFASFMEFFLKLQSNNVDLNPIICCCLQEKLGNTLIEPGIWLSPAAECGCNSGRRGGLIRDNW